MALEYRISSVKIAKAREQELARAETIKKVKTGTRIKRRLVLELRNPHFWITTISIAVIISILLFAASFSNS